MSVALQIQRLLEKLPSGITLVAVSKFQPVSALMEAYGAGQRCFGESRAQEFVQKVAEMPSDVAWHFIGHLQTNKVKMVVGKAALIHSVDSEGLLDALDKEAQRQGVVQDVLWEVHVAQEESKWGFAPEALPALVERLLHGDWPHLRVCGLMGMASLVSDSQQIRAEFRQIKQAFDGLKAGAFAHSPHFKILSMGMSSDWPIAVEEGSTLIRVGSQIFAP